MRGFFTKVWDPLKIGHTLDCITVDSNYLNIYSRTGADPEILKRGGALCRPPWLDNEENFRFQMVWKGKKALETISFWQNTSFSIFRFSPYLYLMKPGRRNLINFSKFTNTLIKKEKKHLYSSQWKKKTETSWTLFYNRLFYKAL